MRSLTLLDAGFPSVGAFERDWLLMVLGKTLEIAVTFIGVEEA